MRRKLLPLTIASALIALSATTSADESAPVVGGVTVFANTPFSRTISVTLWEGKPDEKGVPKKPTPTKQYYNDTFKKCAVEGAETLQDALSGDNGESFRKFTTCSKDFKIDIKVIRYRSTHDWAEVPEGGQVDIDTHHLSIPVYCNEDASNVETPELIYEDISRVFANAPKSLAATCNSSEQTPAPARPQAPPPPSAKTSAQTAAVKTIQQLAPLNNAPATPPAASTSANTEQKAIKTPEQIFEQLRQAQISNATSATQQP